MVPESSGGGAAGGSSAAAPKRHLEGYRWYLILGIGLLQLVLAPYVPIPWLPADKVLLGGEWVWSIWGVLVLFFIVSAFPLEQSGLTWVRFASALLQGLVAGHLLIFDSSTLYARASWAFCLGIANALDRLASIRHTVDTTRALPGSLKVTVGAVGHIKYEGQDYEVTVKSVVGNQLTLHYDKNPFWWNNSEVVPMGCPRLTITNGFAVNDKLVTDHIHSGFRLRPLGYTLGVCISQWVLYGFSVADSFVSGMLTGQAMIIFAPPVVVLILWVISVKYPDNEYVQCLGFFLFCASAALIIVAFLPVSVALVAFAAAELWAHQVIAFIAIVADNVLFFAVVRPSAEDLAKYGLSVMILNADSYLATVAASRVTQNPPPLADHSLRASLLNA